MSDETFGGYIAAGLPTLRTERLVLRPFTPGDAADVQRVCGRREIADTTLSISHPYPDGAAEEWIATHAKAFAEGKAVHLAIALAGAGEYIGSIALAGVSGTHRHGEFGYVIAVEHWRRGYCTEAAAALLRYAFEQMGLHRVFAHHLTRNPASGRVMQKIGMRHEGRLRDHILKWGCFEDIECYGVLRGDVRGGEPPESTKNA